MQVVVLSALDLLLLTYNIASLTSYDSNLAAITSRSTTFRQIQCSPTDYQVSVSARTPQHFGCHSQRFI